MTTDEKIKLITRNLEETLTEEELRQLIDSDTPLKHYIGFEISGKLHIGYLFTLMKVKDLQDAGADTIIFLADYHSAINDKLGGDLDVLKKVSLGYFTDAVKAIFSIIGGDPDKLNFILSSDIYSAHPDFWMTFLEMGKNTSLARTKRSITIMGREQSDESIDTAKLMYPMMQAADIFLLQVNIAHAGIDQRKVHVIARENAMQIKRYPLKNAKGEQIKPVAIHHPILLGLNAPTEETITYTIDSSGAVDVTLNTLKEPIVIPTIRGSVLVPTSLTGKFEDTSAEVHTDVGEIAMRTKMSKSKVGSGIIIHDSPEEIREKITQAFAPEGIVENNPVLNWTRFLVFYEPNTTLVVKRDPKWGGDLTYNSYEELEKDYVEKKLHPQDLKTALAEWLIQKLEPVRRYFEEPARKAALEEITTLTSRS